MMISRGAYSFYLGPQPMGKGQVVRRKICTDMILDKTQNPCMNIYILIQQTDTIIIHIYHSACHVPILGSLSRVHFHNVPRIETYYAE
jgi:hypothetical protein